MLYARRIRFIVALAVWSAAPVVMVAQETESLLPSDAPHWVNSPPLTQEALEGKAALLWFYEETCPRCREKWPELLSLAEKYQDKPTVFIGVNSGNPWTAVASYARDNRINWPIVVDADRQLEAQARVGEISLQNIYQVAILTPEGRLQRASFTDLESAADRALVGAKWNVDPAEIPDSLRDAWRAIEFNEFASVANVVKKAAASRVPEEKAAAEQLLAFVGTKLQEEATTAKQLDDAGQAWEAYKAYQAFSERFEGYFPPESATARMRELASEGPVKDELAAAKALEAARKMAANPRTRDGAVRRLKTLAANLPDTEAGREALVILTQLNVP